MPSETLSVNPLTVAATLFVISACNNDPGYDHRIHADQVEPFIGPECEEARQISGRHRVEGRLVSELIQEFVHPYFVRIELPDGSWERGEFTFDWNRKAPINLIDAEASDSCFAFPSIDFLLEEASFSGPTTSFELSVGSASISFEEDWATLYLNATFPRISLETLPRDDLPPCDAFGVATIQIDIPGGNVDGRITWEYQNEDSCLVSLRTTDFESVK